MSEKDVLTPQTEDKQIVKRSAKLEKYLTFNLDRGVYGLEILSVKEIIGLMNITRLPRTPDYVRGIINLRGQVIPVVDLRKKFGLETVEDTDASCIIVVQITDSEKEITTGVLVDSVAEVMDINGASIENTPSLGTEINTDFISGIGKIGEKVVIILDIEKTIDFREVMAAVA